MHPLFFLGSSCCIFSAEILFFRNVFFFNFRLLKWMSIKNSFFTACNFRAITYLIEVYFDKYLHFLIVSMNLLDLRNLKLKKYLDFKTCSDLFCLSCSSDLTSKSLLILERFFNQENNFFSYYVRLINETKYLQFLNIFL